MPGSVCRTACLEDGDELVNRGNRDEEVNGTAHLEGGVLAHGFVGMEPLGIDCICEHAGKCICIHGITFVVIVLLVRMIPDNVPAMSYNTRP